MKDRLLGIVAAGSIGIFGGACSTNTSEKPQITTVPNVEKTIDLPQDRPVSELLIEKVYPEFKDQNLKSTDFFYLDPIQTDSLIPTEVINYSSKTMDHKVAEEIYRQLSFYANLEKPLTADGSLVEPGAQIVTTGRNETKLRTMIIIPAEANLPLSGQPLIEKLEPSGATLNTEAGYTFSFIRLDQSKFEDLENVNDNATFSFAIEACQQILSSKTIASDGSEIKREELDLGQELTCNSFGIAIASKSLNWSYEKYINFIQNHSVGNVGIFKLDENVYESFSSFGSITK